MHLDLYVALAGLIVGFMVGLTGMGGGALMTPILVLLFKIPPLSAVSSDLVAAVIMRPIGGSVHIRRRTVNWELVRYLCLGSVPTAFVGVLVLRRLGTGTLIQSRLEILLGAALLVASTTILAKSALQRRAVLRRERMGAGGQQAPEAQPFVLKKVRTVLIGAAGGLVVGMTSVGSGSLIIVMLLLVYPMLSSKELVGTDLIQAVPLVASAALGHLLFGNFKLGLTASVVIGSVPGVYLGAKLSSRAPDGIVRPVLVAVLLASGLKLVNVPTEAIGYVLLVLALTIPPIMGAFDAARRPLEDWLRAGHSKRRWRWAIGARVVGSTRCCRWRACRRWRTW